MMPSSVFASRLRRLLLALACVFALAACDKTLITALPESESNEVLAVLLAAGVPADKASADNGKTWNISVPEERIVQALELLRARGLPRSRHASLGEMFKKDGLISTPVEERVRFVYGVSQELAETLSRMDGVVTARVHIVLPNNDPLAKENKPSSASVFIKHRADFPAASLTAPVKNLVAHSVEGLSYDNVSVTFVPAEASPLPVPYDGAIGSGNRQLLWGVVVLALVAAGAGAWLRRHPQQRTHCQRLLAPLRTRILQWRKRSEAA